MTNTGNVPLTVELSDDRIALTGATCAPIANGATLAAGASTTCTLTSTAQATQTDNGVYTNTATVTGTPVLPAAVAPELPGFPTPPVTAPPVTGTDPVAL